VKAVEVGQKCPTCTFWTKNVQLALPPPTPQGCKKARSELTKPKPRSVLARLWRSSARGAFLQPPTHRYSVRCCFCAALNVARPHERRVFRSKQIARQSVTGCGPLRHDSYLRIRIYFEQQQQNLMRDVRPGRTLTGNSFMSQLQFNLTCAFLMVVLTVGPLNVESSVCLSSFTTAIMGCLACASQSLKSCFVQVETSMTTFCLFASLTPKSVIAWWRRRRSRRKAAY